MVSSGRSSGSFGGVPPAVVWIGLALIPLSVSAISVLRLSYHPAGDIALLELRTRDLGHDAVLVGPFSREGWFHLGPTVFYLFALPYHLTGGSSLALLLTALIVNGASVTGVALIARRHGGTTLMVATLVGCALLVRSFGAEFVRSPWNPTMTVLPMGLMVSLTWAMTCGSAWALPTGAAVTTFLVQTHVGYIGLAAPLLLFGVCWLVAFTWRARHVAPTSDAQGDPHPARALRRAAGVSIAVLTILWLPPIVDQVTNERGNLQAVLDHFVSRRDQLPNLTDGLKVLSPQFSIDAAWLTGERSVTVRGEPRALANPKLPLLAVAIGAAAAVLLTRGSGSARRYVMTVGLAIVLGVVTIARTPGPLYMYRLDWAPVFGMMAALTIVWTLADALPGELRASLRAPALVIASAALILLAGANSVAAVRADVPNSRLSAAIAGLTPQVFDDLPPGDGQVIFSRGPEIIAGSVGRGLELSLERRGVHTAAGGEEDRGEPRRAAYLVAADRWAIDLLAEPRFELVARSGPDTLDELEPGEHIVAVFRLTSTGP